MNRASVESLPAVCVTPEGADAVRGIGTVAALPATDRAALADLGLVGEDGHFTPAGRRLRDDLRGAPVVLLFSTEPDGGTRRARVYVGARQMMYLAVHPVHEARQTSELLVFPADAVPVVLAGWGRLQPMLQTADDRHGPIDPDAFRRRCQTAAEPVPAGADDTLAGIWRTLWRVWGAQCDLREIALTYVDVEGYGTYVVRRDDDGAITLGTRPSSLLWGDLQSVLRPLCPRPTDW